MIGPPGAGKTMLASRFAGLLPAMTDEEALESAAVQSLTGGFKAERWKVRPFRSPHHTSSGISLVGGGAVPRPGEISLAHYGVLFLDELPSSTAACWKCCVSHSNRARSAFRVRRSMPISRRASS